MKKIGLLLCLLGYLALAPVNAQKKLEIKPMDRPTAFFPEAGKACVELITPLQELNIVSTFGEVAERSVNEDKLYVYRFVFDLTDESKRTLFISAPGYVKESLQLVLSNKQRVFYTVFPPEDKFKFDRALLGEYVFSGTAPIGIRLAYGKRFGGYLSYKMSTVRKEGVEIESVNRFYDVKNASDQGYIRQSITGGVRMGIMKWMYLYLGAGYGQYGRLWENPSEVEGKRRFTSDYQKGPEIELGVSFRWRNWCISGGTTALIGESFMCDYQAGIGYYINFKKKQ